TMSGSSGTVVTLNGANSYLGKTTINGGTLKIGANNVMPDSSEVVMANTSGAILDVNGKTDTIGSLSGGGSSGGNITLGTGGALTVNQFTFGIYGGVISGAGSFTKSSYGTLWLDRANTYTGGTTISGGEIIIGATNALPNTSLTFTGTSRLLLIFSDVTQQIGTLSANGVTGAEINLANRSNVLTVTQSADATYSGTIIGDGALTKEGSSTLTLSGTNTYTGKTTINAGIIKIGANNVMPDYSEVVLANTSGVALDVNGKTDTIGSISGGGASGGNITLESGSGTGALTVNQFTNGDYAGVISGNGSFTKSSYGVLRLTSANTYTGATAVTGGDLIVMVNNGIPNTALSLTGTARLLLLQDGLSLNVGTLSGESGALAWLYPNSTLTINQASDATFAGTIKDNTSGSVVKTGSGTLTLTGTNTYQGSTTVSAGTLSLSGTNNAITSSIAMSIASGANLNINGTTQTIGTLSGSGNINFGSGSAALTVSQRTFSEYSGIIGGTGSFTKSGVGTLKLNNSNTYSGNTVLAAGEIIVGVSDALPITSALSFTGASRLLMLGEGISQGFSSLTSSVGLTSSIFGYGNNIFNLNQSSSTTFNGGLFGGFSFVKSGVGTLTLTSGAQGSVLTTIGGIVN
ncbi:MAG: Heme/hemopexin-binding protein, partial [Pseudomonadota bacterium]